MTRRALITGVTGMLGRQLARDLRACGYTVFGCARDPLGHVPAGLDWHPTACDVRDAGSVLTAVRLSSPHVIYHLAAAQASATKSLPPSELYATNLSGTVHLLLAAAGEAPEARIVIAGSGAEYGPVRCAGSRRRWTEDALSRPVSAYAASKAATTQAALVIGAAHQLNVTVARLFNLVGPSTASDSAPAWFARQIAEIEQNQREPMLTCGNLRAVRDFVDVRDAAHALCLMADRQFTHRLYNICSGQGTPLHKVAGTLRSLSTRPQLTIPAAGEPAGPDRLVGDPRRFQRETGWAPRIPPTSMLKDLLDHWRSLVRGEGRKA